MLDFYTLKLRFGFQEEELVGRYQTKFVLPPDAGIGPILEYFEGLSFVPKDLSWATLLGQGWRFVIEPHPAGICWIFVSPKMTARLLHREPVSLVGKYLALQDTYGMLPEWSAWKEAESESAQ